MTFKPRSKTGSEIYTKWLYVETGQRALTSDYGWPVSSRTSRQPLYSFYPTAFIQHLFYWLSVSLFCWRVENKWLVEATRTLFLFLCLCLCLFRSTARHPHPRGQKTQPQPFKLTHSVLKPTASPSPPPGSISVPLMTSFYRRKKASPKTRKGCHHKVTHVWQRGISKRLKIYKKRSFFVVRFNGIERLFTHDDVTSRHDSVSIDIIRSLKFSFVRVDFSECAYTFLYKFSHRFRKIDDKLWISDKFSIKKRFRNVEQIIS